MIFFDVRKQAMLIMMLAQNMFLRSRLLTSNLEGFVEMIPTNDNNKKCKITA